MINDEMIKYRQTNTQAKYLLVEGGCLACLPTIDTLLQCEQIDETVFATKQVSQTGQGVDDRP